MNYIINCRDFPESWAEGLRSSIFKNGQRNIVENYRGITVPPIFAKIFELMVHNRLVYVEEAFEKFDAHNGGFMKGCKTTDNIFILNGIIERQLILGQPLLVCFVDFSKAFDLINRNILFYKLIKSG